MILDKRTKIDRIGETRLNNNGNAMTIIKYTNAKNILVEFEDKTTTITNYYNFQIGEVKNPYDKTIYKIGYLGKKNITKQNKYYYNIWCNVLCRCYDINSAQRYPSYIIMRCN